jgi:hypothetical protein
MESDKGIDFAEIMEQKKAVIINVPKNKSRTIWRKLFHFY